MNVNFIKILHIKLYQDKMLYALVDNMDNVAQFDILFLHAFFSNLIETNFTLSPKY